MPLCSDLALVPVAQLGTAGKSTAGAGGCPNRSPHARTQSDAHFALRRLWTYFCHYTERLFRCHVPQDSSLPKLCFAGWFTMPQGNKDPSSSMQSRWPVLPVSWSCCAPFAAAKERGLQQSKAGWRGNTRSIRTIVCADVPAATACVLQG